MPAYKRSDSPSLGLGFRQLGMATRIKKAFDGRGHRRILYYIGECMHMTTASYSVVQCSTTVGITKRDWRTETGNIQQCEIFEPLKVIFTNLSRITAIVSGIVAQF